MDNFARELQIRWADLDPNNHLRHSVYYDWGAYCRVEFLQQYGLTTGVMQELHFGPILFREECTFKKEIGIGDDITINLRLAKARKDFSRWTIQHEIMKNGDTLAALLTVDGAWLDRVKRKLAAPPPMVGEVFSRMPMDVNFQWLD